MQSCHKLAAANLNAVQTSHRCSSEFAQESTVEETPIMPTVCLDNAVPRRIISALLHQPGTPGSPGTARQQHQNGKIHRAQLPARQSVSAVHQGGQYVFPVHCIPAADSWLVPNFLGHNSWTSMFCLAHQCHQGMTAFHAGNYQHHPDQSDVMTVFLPASCGIKLSSCTKSRPKLHSLERCCLSDFFNC